MHDQADELRQLVLQNAVRGRRTPAPRPPLVVIAESSANGEVASLALSLATELVHTGGRTVLVDANLTGPLVTTRCQAAAGHELLEIFAGQRNVHEVLRRGPTGVQLVPGIPTGLAARGVGPVAQQRLLDELARLGPHADYVVLDAGAGFRPSEQMLWQAADLLLLLTQSDASAVMKTYAVIKQLAAGQRVPAICTLVQPSAAEDAQAAQQRLVHACQQFLNLTIHAGPAWSPEEQPAATSSVLPWLTDQVVKLARPDSLAVVGAA